jgi:hypothetical protein
MMSPSRIATSFLPAVIWMAVIFYFSVISQPQVPGGGQAGDDISYLHLPAYFILSSLLLRGNKLLFIRASDMRAFTSAIAISTLYGAMMEIAQMATLIRFFSLMDIMLDLAGSAVIIVFMHGVPGKLLLMGYRD